VNATVLASDQHGLVFAGGGTGGHVFPMLAVADAVRALAPDVPLVFIGTERGLETKLVPDRGYRLELVRAIPMRGGGVTGALRGAVRAARSIPEMRALLASLAPKAVFSIGGYAAGPVAVAARLLSIPLALMEPNSEVGIANRLVAPLVQRAYTAFPESEKHFGAGAVLRTGVPLRAGFRPSAYAPGKELRVLVLGGSQGAVSLNESVPRALARVKVPVRVVHQCGAGKDGAVRALYDELGAGTRAQVLPFIDDVAAELSRADLVIGRAGAGAVAEICAVGRPSLLIPYPFAGDHQRHNAESIARAGASVCVRAQEATADRLAREIERLASEPGRLSTMAKAALELGRPDAALIVAKDLLSLAGLAPNGASGPTLSAGTVRTVKPSTGDRR
jgi:UDP-N-acetylglucosamine--N-acetylmuramyl-(pentapeptide) pyrophosphoryl-undecaprenol N-acetylglucosamine transferase